MRVGVGDKFLHWLMGIFVEKEHAQIWNIREQSWICGILPKQTKYDKKCEYGEVHVYGYYSWYSRVYSNAVQNNRISHTATLSIAGEFWSEYCYYFGKNWLWCNDTAPCEFGIWKV